MMKIQKRFHTVFLCQQARKGETIMTISSSNYVLIRVWNSENNQVTPGEDVGHVSVEIFQNGESVSFSSLWPEKGIDTSEADAIKAGGHNVTSTVQFYHALTKVEGVVKPVGANFHATPQVDFDAEGRLPEYTIALYSLNTEAMRQKAADLQTKTNGWRVVGRNLIRVGRSSDHSCASLAYEILKAGGIYDLVGSHHSSHNSSCTSPDGLGKTVIDAKRSELKKHGSTKSWHPELPAYTTEDGGSIQECESRLPAHNPKSGLTLKGIMGGR